MYLILDAWLRNTAAYWSGKRKTEVILGYRPAAWQPLFFIIPSAQIISSETCTSLSEFVCLFFSKVKNDREIFKNCHSWENQTEGFRILLPVGGLGQMTFPYTQTLTHRYTCVHWPLEPLAGSDYKPRAYLASHSYQVQHLVWPNFLIHGLLLPW